MVPVEEDNVFALAHITIEFPDIDTGIDAVNHDHKTVTFVFEFENDGHGVGFRGLVLVIAHLDPKCRRVTVQEKLFEILLRILVEFGSRTPTDRMIEVHFDATSQRETNQVDLPSLAQNLLNNTRVIEKGLHVDPSKKISRQSQVRSPKTGVLETLNRLITNDELISQSSEIPLDQNAHTNPPARYLVQLIFVFELQQY